MSQKFFHSIEGASRALSDDLHQQWISYDELRVKIEVWRVRFAQPKSVLFLQLRNNIESVACLLGAMWADQVAALIDPDISETKLKDLIARYDPAFVIASDDCKEGLSVIARDSSSYPIHPDNTLLLSTSGSTGSPKFVRLSLNNLLDNADAIAQVLAIDSNSIAFAHLPLHYSYGLSVITSHLLRGAPVALTNSSLMEKSFWARLQDCGATHFPGVPYHFKMMERLGLKRLPLGGVNVITQAGGHLETLTRQTLWEMMNARGGRFHVLYGQTEASPRMATLAHNDFPIAPDSVGSALPRGCFSILDEDGNEVKAGQIGNIVYAGPNVMLGYAETNSELALGDVMLGKLETGDIGVLDGAGRLTISGRSKRFAKVLGLRINLDEVEKVLADNFAQPIAVLADDHSVHIFAEHNSNFDNWTEYHGAILRQLIASFSIPRGAYLIHRVERVPLNDRQKVDYTTLEALL